MNISLLKEKAENLENLLAHYAKTDIQAAGLLPALSELLNKARLQKISVPLDWNDVPGAYNFTEGTLTQYKDLEQAYADFKIEVTGGETDALKKLAKP